MPHLKTNKKIDKRAKFNSTYTIDPITSLKNKRIKKRTKKRIKPNC
jgi:uncharacterized protein (UPF0371 family)